MDYAEGAIPQVGDPAWMEANENLLRAAADGSADRVDKAFIDGANPRAVDSSGHTAIEIALAAGHSQIIRDLIAHGVPVPSIAGKHIGVLCAAASRGDLDEVTALLAKGVPVDEATPGGFTPMHIAAAMGHISIMQALLSAGANPAVCSDEGVTPLHMGACHSSKVYDVVKLLQNAGVDVATVAGIAHLVAASGDGDAMTLVLDAGVNPNAPIIDIDTAFWRGWQDSVRCKVLRMVPKSVSEYTGGGMNIASLHVAAMLGHDRIVNMLLTGGASVDQHALQDAVVLGHMQVVKQLVAAAPSEAISVLDAAAVRKCVDALALLLQCMQVPPPMDCLLQLSGELSGETFVVMAEYVTARYSETQQREFFGHIGWCNAVMTASELGRQPLLLLLLDRIRGSEELLGELVSTMGHEMLRLVLDAVPPHVHELRLRELDVHARMHEAYALLTEFSWREGTVGKLGRVLALKSVNSLFHIACYSIQTGGPVQACVWCSARLLDLGIDGGRHMLAVLKRAILCDRSDVVAAIWQLWGDRASSDEFLWIVVKLLQKGMVSVFMHMNVGRRLPVLDLEYLWGKFGGATLGVAALRVVLDEWNASSEAYQRRINDLDRCEQACRQAILAVAKMQPCLID